MKKKVIAMMMAVTMVFGLTACGSGSADENAPADTGETGTEETGTEGAGETAESEDGGQQALNLQEIRSCPFRLARIPRRLILR